MNIKSNKKSVHDLPELPLEYLCIGGTLTHADFEQILTIHPNPQKKSNSRQPETQKPKLICPTTSTSSTTQYFTQVLYPKVICYPNIVPNEQLLKQVFLTQDKKKPKTETRIDPYKQPLKLYKLSKFEDKKLESPYFCSVHSGPWSARVYMTRPCSKACPAPPKRWRLEVSSFPNLTLEWLGTWEDIPTDIHPTMTIFTDELLKVATTWECCSGFKKCGEECIDNRFDCDDDIIIF